MAGEPPCLTLVHAMPRAWWAPVAGEPLGRIVPYSVAPLIAALLQISDLSLEHMLPQPQPVDLVPELFEHLGPLAKDFIKLGQDSGSRRKSRLFTGRQ